MEGGLERDAGKKNPDEVRDAKKGLRFASLDEGIVFFSSDGSRYTPSSPEEEQNLQMAAAALMATGKQTPDMPEIQMAMLDADGKVPDLSKIPGGNASSTPPEPPPSPDTPPAPTVPPTPIQTPTTPPGPKPPEPPPAPPPGPPAGGGEPPGGTEAPEGPPLGPWGAIRPDDVVPQRPWVPRNPREYLGIEPKTIDEILADKRDALGFGETFKHMHPGAEELLLRYAAHTQSQDDMTIMNNAAREYAYRLKLFEDVTTRLKPEEIELLSRRERSQVLSDLMAHRKAPRAQEMVHNAVFHLAMEKPELVQKMRASFNELDRLRAKRDYKTLQKGIWSLAERNHVKVSELNTLINTGSLQGREESREHLEQRIHESAGRFRRAMDWTRNKFDAKRMPFSSRNLARKMVSQAEELKGLPIRGEIDSTLRDIVSHLDAALTNPEWRELIAKETLTNKNATLAREGGPGTFEETQQAMANAENKPAAIEQSVRRRIAANPNFASWNRAQQDDWLRNDVKQEEMKKQRGAGFWAWLASVLFSQNVDKGINAAAGHSVFATA